MYDTSNNIKSLYFARSVCWYTNYDSRNQQQLFAKTQLTLWAG
jgi:hypothetical protein